MAVHTIALAGDVVRLVQRQSARHDIGCQTRNPVENRVCVTDGCFRHADFVSDVTERAPYIFYTVGLCGDHRPLPLR